MRTKDLNRAAASFWAILVLGCAHTEVRDSQGHLVLWTNMDAQEVVSTPGDLHVLGMNHTGPTLAGGTAFAQGVNAVGGAATSAVLAAGSSGLFNAGAAASSKALIIPTAAVASSVASKPKVPVTATPAPTPLTPKLATPAPTSAAQAERLRPLKPTQP